MTKEKTPSKQELVDILRAQYGFKTTAYAMGMGAINYKKQTLLKIIEILRSRRITSMMPVTKCNSTKEKIAKDLKFAYGLEFHPHEINYIPREEFIVLYNTLIEPHYNIGEK